MDEKRDIELLYEIGNFRHMRRMWERFLNSRKMWREIDASNPFDWHLLGRNRFRGGDWQAAKP